MVTGYQKPSSGSIWFQGRDITRLAPREITRMGICRSFQVPQVFMSSSLFDNLLLGLGVAETERPSPWRPLRQPHLVEAADQIIARYSLGQYRDQQVALLPQGVRKLLDIAMAMAHRPRIVLLDEPTSGVSVGEKFGIMDVVMGALRDTGVTVLFIEHDMEIVARYGSRVIAFSEGTILADGPPERVLADEQVRRYVIGEEVHRTSPAPGGGPDQPGGRHA
jgi:branched-chain amino acid transport system ATP-binding protein